MSSSALLRAQVEASLAERVAAPFGTPQPVAKPVLPTGIAAVDTALGGIPCGAITEIVGPAWCSAGRKSLLAQVLAHSTQEQFCALIDATDSFDPRSAGAGGVNLKRLLWVRCGGKTVETLERAFKATDMLLQGSGGFRVIAADVAGIPERLVRKIPLTTWFRFSRVVEKLPAALIFVTPCAVAGACASLTLNLSRVDVRWSQPAQESPPHAHFSAALDFEVDIRAKRSSKKSSPSARIFSAQRRWA